MDRVDFSEEEIELGNNGEPLPPEFNEDRDVDFEFEQFRDDAFDAMAAEFDRFICDVGARFFGPLKYYRGAERKIAKSIEGLCRAKLGQSARW